MPRRKGRTEVAVLGALSVSPMTGYALRNAIRDVLGHFWSESFGQIYPTLNTLEDQGHVSRASSEAGRTGATHFEVTPTGLSRLKELLGEPIEPPRPRNGLLLRLFFGRHLGRSACMSLLEAARDEAQARLTGFEAIRAEMATEVAAGLTSEVDQTYWTLTISAGEHAARATIAWADESLQTLQKLDGEARP